MNERRVVITGCGVATPLGIGVDALWDGLIARKSGIGPIKAFDAGGLKSRLGAEVPDYKMADFVPKTYRKSTKVMARDIELAVVCALEATRHAKLITKCTLARDEADGALSVDSTRFGANIGAGLICADLQELAGALQTSGDHASGAFDEQKWGEEGMYQLTPLWLLKFLPNMLACHVTIIHECRGPSNSTFRRTSSTARRSDSWNRLPACESHIEHDTWHTCAASSRHVPLHVLRH